MAEQEETSLEGDETPLEEIVSGAVTALTLLVGFGLMFADVSYFWVVFPVGFAGVLPLALGLVKLYHRQEERDTTTTPSDETEDALEELRQRYARGEFTDEEFERRVERLLETESVTDARKYTEHVRAEQRADGRDRERELE